MLRRRKSLRELATSTWFVRGFDLYLIFLTEFLQLSNSVYSFCNWEEIRMLWNVFIPRSYFLFILTLSPVNKPEKKTTLSMETFSRDRDNVIFTFGYSWILWLVPWCLLVNILFQYSSMISSSDRILFKSKKMSIHLEVQKYQLKLQYFCESKYFWLN